MFHFSFFPFLPSQAFRFQPFCHSDQIKAIGQQPKIDEGECNSFRTFLCFLGKLCFSFTCVFFIVQKHTKRIQQLMDVFQICFRKKAGSDKAILEVPTVKYL